MKKPKLLETEIGRVITDWLNSEGWEVFPEVFIGPGLPRPDIVAKKQHLTWIIECKTSLSTKLLDQILYWHHNSCSQFCSIAYYGKGYNNQYLLGYMQRQGVGIFRVHDYKGYLDLAQYNKPKYKRIPIKFKNKWIINYLDEAQKKFKAGTASGSYHTPFKDSVENLTKYVEANPGCSLKDAIENMDAHHWSSDQTARSCISKYIQGDIIKSVRIERDGRKIHLFPVTQRNIFTDIDSVAKRNIAPLAPNGDEKTI